jgi:hypothetical protein
MISDIFNGVCKTGTCISIIKLNCGSFGAELNIHKIAIGKKDLSNVLHVENNY